MEEWGPLVPRHVGAGVDHVVSLERGHRDVVNVLEVEARDELVVIGADLVVDLLRPADEVHLVHRDHHVADAEQRGDEAVAAGLGDHAIARIDQHHREITGRGAGGHVAGVLFVAGRVGDDEHPLVGGKIAIGHIDGDALLALGFQSVGQQRRIKVRASGAVGQRVLADRGQLILVDRFGVMQEPADEGGFTIIDASAGEKPQKILGFVTGKIFVDVHNVAG